MASVHHATAPLPEVQASAPSSPPVEAAESGKLCLQCARPNLETAKFCTNCGAPFQQQQLPEQPSLYEADTHCGVVPKFQQQQLPEQPSLPLQLFVPYSVPYPAFVQSAPTRKKPWYRRFFSSGRTNTPS